MVAELHTYIHASDEITGCVVEAVRPIVERGTGTTIDW